MADITRHSIRKQLLANGYAPLPLKGKACYLKGWSYLEITDEFLDDFARKAAWDNTGLRCDQLLAVDIDVDDRDLADLLEDWAFTVFGPTDAIRYGKGEKRLLLYRVDEAQAKRRTARYEAPDGTSAQVELLGRGCQFAAYGVHPDTQTPYEWVGDVEPATTSHDALPLADPALTDELLQHCEAAIIDAGYEMVSHGSSGEQANDYCLTEASKFDVTDPGHGLMTIAEIKAQLPKGEYWECNLTAIRPTSDSRAGRIHWGESGQISVADFVTGCTYFEALTLGEAGEKVGELLPAEPDQSLFGPTGGKELGDLIQFYVYVAEDDTVRSLDEPAAGVRFANFSKLHYRKVITPAHPRGVLMANAWLEDHHTLTCERAVLRPDTTERLIPEGRRTLLNTYMPPAHDEALRGETDTFYDFVDHLLPHELESDMFLDWLACKVKNPAVRMHAMIMVAEEFGTGRGTLFEIAQALFGQRYCMEIPFSKIAGDTYQSQYNDWMSQTLLAFVPEAHDGHVKGSAHHFATKANAYEHIKLLVDTGAGRKMITRKGASNVNEMVYTSIFIATNHRSAVAIQAGDRRCIVLENGERLSGRLAARIRAWMGNPANLSALWHELSERDVEYDPYGDPPMTEAKRTMVTAGQSDIDTAWTHFVDNAPGDVATVKQWIAWADSIQDEFDFVYPDRKTYQHVMRTVLTDKAWRVRPTETTWQLRVGKARVRPWVIRNPDQWQHAGNDEIAAQIELNGDPGGLVVKLPERPKKPAGKA